MKKIAFLLFVPIFLTACKTDQKPRELQVIQNVDSSELTLF
jgi:thiamine monophosphate synthase